MNESVCNSSGINGRRFWRRGYCIPTATETTQRLANRQLQKYNSQGDSFSGSCHTLQTTSDWRQSFMQTLLQNRARRQEMYETVVKQGASKDLSLEVRAEWRLREGRRHSSPASSSFIHETGRCCLTIAVFRRRNVRWTEEERSLSQLVGQLLSHSLSSFLELVLARPSRFSWVSLEFLLAPEKTGMQSRWCILSKAWRVLLKNTFAPFLVISQWRMTIVCVIIMKPVAFTRFQHEISFKKFVPISRCTSSCIIFFILFSRNRKRSGKS